MDAMAPAHPARPKYVGQPMPRREDDRLTTGAGRYVDDIHLPGMLHAAFLRSPYAHARICSVDVSAALAMPGVHAAITGEDARTRTKPMGTLVPTPRQITHYCLAVGKVRFMGEPVAAVAADTRAIAEDAPERFAAADQRLRKQRTTVQVQQVEGEKGDRPTGLARQPPRQLTGIRPSCRIHDHQLAVQDRGACHDPDRQSGQFRQRRGDLLARCVADPHLAGAGLGRRPDPDQRPLAAPPRLEQVLVRIERGGEGTRQHRPQVREIGQLVGLEAQRKLVGHRRSMVAR